MISSRILPFIVLLALACRREPSQVTTRSASTALAVGLGDSAIVVRRLTIDTGQIQMFDQALSADGHFVLGLDVGTGNVARRDLRTGEKRLLTTEANWNSPSGREAEEPRVSPDGQLVAYAWSMGGPAFDYELRTIGIDGTGVRTLLKTNASISEAYPADWTRDGRSVLAFVYGQDNSTQLAVVSVADGSTHVLKSFDWRSPVGARFSPDGTWLAYDFQPDQTKDERDIFVLQAKGSSERRVTFDGVRKFVVGWSENGDGLFYSTTKDDATAVWFVPMREGSAAGSPRLVRSDLWGAQPIGIASGAVYYTIRDDKEALYSIPLDLKSGRAVGVPTLMASGVSNASPALWSPDGRSVVYVRGHAGTSPANQNQLIVRDIATGEERIAPPRLQYARLESWAPDGRSLVVLGSTRGHNERYRVDLTTGKAALLAVMNAPENAAFSSDGRTAYIARNSGRERFVDSGRVVRRDVTTGEERELYRGRQVFGPRLSPDGTQLAFVTEAPDSGAERNRTSIMLVTPNGSEVRSVLSGTFGGGSLNWTQDGQRLLFREFLAEGDALSILTLATGQVQRLITGKTGFGGPRLSPDDRHVLYTATSGGKKRELWVMESLPGSRSRAVNDAR